MTGSTEPNEHRTSISPRTLNVLLTLTVVTGILVAWLVTHKEKYFPEMYTSHVPDEHHSSPHNSATDPVHHTDSSQKASEIKHEREEEAATNPSADLAISDGGKFALIAGSFQQMENAMSLQKIILRLNQTIAPEIMKASINDTTFYRVVVARSDHYTRLESLKSDLSAEGLKDMWINTTQD
jgi:cell division protein FtsN